MAIIRETVVCDLEIPSERMVVFVQYARLSETIAERKRFDFKSMIYISKRLLTIETNNSYIKAIRIKPYLFCSIFEDFWLKINQNLP